MYKQHLLGNIEKEINICKRLYTKLPADKMNFSPGEGVRTALELLQYLTIAPTLALQYWLKENGTDFMAYYNAKIAASRKMEPARFLSAMDEQKQIAQQLLDELSEDDLFNKEVEYPWSGEKAPLGEAIIATSVRWLAAYKLQLFLFIKLCADKQLATADAWALTELPV